MNKYIKPIAFSVCCLLALCFTVAIVMLPGVSVVSLAGGFVSGAFGVKAFIAWQGVARRTP